jgi:ligand-binding SRPBCC domain-containing protein
MSGVAQGPDLRTDKARVEWETFCMTIFTFKTSLRLPRPRSEVFPFFADARNLQSITPAWLDFQVLTPDVVIETGALIDYRLKVHGIPLRWRTRICEWEPPVRFIDEQIRGPYRLWRHEHTFEEVEGATECRDRVEYAVFGGRLLNRLLVRRDVERIFAHRQRCLRAVFPVEGASRAL